jgi:hypothetical protein
LGTANHTLKSQTAHAFSESRLGPSQSKKERNTLGDQIKKSNFDVGSSHLASKNPYKSETKAAHNEKGDSAKIKATLDADK